jgi:hypothetical protein
MACALRGFFYLMTLGAMSALGGSQSVWVGWNVAPWEQHIVQYRVFYGSESGSYTDYVDSYNWDGATINYLTEGSTNYFAVVGIDADGDQTPMSEELMFVVPTQNQPRLVSEIHRFSSTGQPFGMSVTGSWNLPAFWEVDYSSDLVNWELLQTGVGTNFWTYVGFDTGAQNYFRLILF